MGSANRHWPNGSMTRSSASLLDDYVVACVQRRLNYPGANDLSELLQRAGWRVIGEHVTPRKRRFFEIDADTPPDTSSIIIATRD
jgi:hypothetical protein